MIDSVPEDFAARLVEDTAEAIIYCDKEGLIRFWNKSAERVFGYIAAEASGQSLDLIIPERLRRAHWDGWNRFLGTGVSRYGAGDTLAVPALRKDGAQISVEFTIQMLRDQHGAIMGIAAVLRDVTKRFEEMKALRRQLASLQQAKLEPTT